MELVEIPGVDEWVKKCIADAPPLSDETRNRIRVLFGVDKVDVRPRSRELVAA